MHETQKFILMQLISKDSARYSDLKPPSMEGSKFTYHLKQLLDSKLIRYDTADKRYCLSSEGRLLADHFDTELLEASSQPAIVVLAAVERKPHEWLLAKRHIQPAFGMKGFPHIHVALGDKLVEQAEQNLFAMTALRCDLRYHGHAYVTQYQKAELESTVLVHFLRGSYVDGDLTNSTDDYTFEWVSNVNWSDPEIIPSSGDMLNLSERKDMFFAELTYHL